MTSVEATSPRLPTGIEGIDHITGGGLPTGCITLVLGGPGTGKTVFSLQVLLNGLRDRGEAGVFVALEETVEQVRRNAPRTSEYAALLDDERLCIIEAGPTVEEIEDLNVSLQRILDQASALVRKHKATRVVFDGLEEVIGLLFDPNAERVEALRIQNWVAEHGVMAIITDKLAPNQLPARRYTDYLQYQAQAVMVLTHQVNRGVASRRLRFIKYRGSGCSSNEVPFVISESGIEAQLALHLEKSVPKFENKISTGVDELDEMLAGGYFAGSSILVTGAPGTSKTSLAGAFVAAACKRGEHALYFAFDEPGEQIVGNLRSIGIDLEPFIENGLLTMVTRRAQEFDVEHYFVEIGALVRRMEPSVIAIDPLSAIARGGEMSEAMAMAQRLVNYLKGRRTTGLFTALTHRDDGMEDRGTIHVSTIADSWLHLTYNVHEGERNRLISIVKARGTGHSNQERELILSQEGIRLTDVYVAGGEVLTGTARLEREQAEALEERLQRSRFDDRSRTIEDEIAELREQQARLERQLGDRERQLSELRDLEALRRRGLRERTQAVRRARFGDGGEAGTDADNA